MSDAPKTIEVDTHEAEYLCAVKFHDPQDDTPTTIYRRADLPPTREQIMADPRVMALVEALKGALDELQECSLIICGEDYNSPSHNAALAALADNEGETE